MLALRTNHLKLSTITSKEAEIFRKNISRLGNLVISETLINQVLKIPVSLVSRTRSPLIGSSHQICLGRHVRFLLSRVQS